jgi:hypothetical protein
MNGSRRWRPFTLSASEGYLVYQGQPYNHRSLTLTTHDADEAAAEVERLLAG